MKSSLFLSFFFLNQFKYEYIYFTLLNLLQHPDWRGQGVVVDKQRSRATVLIPELDLITYLHLREDRIQLTARGWLVSDSIVLQLVADE